MEIRHARSALQVLSVRTELRRALTAQLAPTRPTGRFASHAKKDSTAKRKALRAATLAWSVRRERTRPPKVSVIRSKDVMTAVQESTALNQALLAPSSVARHVQEDGFKILQGILLASKSNQAKWSQKEEALPFKFLWDRKFVTMAVIAPTIRLRLKHAREELMARIHLRISAWSAQQDIQPRKQRLNVNLGTSSKKISFFILVISSASLLTTLFLLPSLSLSLSLSLLLLFTTTATKESPTPSLAFHAPSALQDSSKIKTPCQALLARHAR